MVFHHRHHHRRRRLVLVRMGTFALLACLLPCVATRTFADDAPQPNIIFILADDLGWADIGYHDSDVRTPHLDRLAGDGTRLNQHYVYPTCSPTRVALLSGRFPSRFGVLGPLGYGFDTSYGYLRGQIDPYTHRYKFGDHVTWHRDDQFVEECGHVTDLITDEAIRVIESAGQEPFFLYVAHHSPHYPLNEPPKWIAPYEQTIEDVWRRHFAAAISHLDDGVGQIVRALERTGLRDKTLITTSRKNKGVRSIYWTFYRK